MHRIAVVGCGNVSGLHFAGYRAHPERAEVVAACDPVAGRRAWAEREHGVPRTFATLDDLLDHPGWDVAVVCTPSEVREPAVAALAAIGYQGWLCVDEESPAPLDQGLHTSRAYLRDTLGLT